MKFFVALILILLVAVPAFAATELYALNVGKGDALIVLADDCAVLIDTGKGHAAGRIQEALKQLNIDRLDAVFITHVDNDHIEGLQFFEQTGFPVDAWYASPCFFEYKEKKHPLVKMDVDVQWLEAGDKVVIGEAEFDVLAPVSKNEDDEDENSLVMMLTTSNGRILLTGDMEHEEEAALLASGADLSCDVLKVANHGDDDTTSAGLIGRTGAQVAVISTDPVEKPDTPSPRVISELENARMQVLRTDASDVVWVSLTNGNASARNISWANVPEYGGITLQVDRDSELFAIHNDSGAEISLEGWYLYSDKGNELFMIPGGTVPDGGSAVIGTKTSPEGTYDILWDEKNVISNKNEDLISLYAPDGSLIFSTY